MSVQASSWALSQETGSPARKLLLFMLADHGGMAGAGNAPTPTLSDLCEMSPGEMCEHLRALQEIGLIIWDGEAYKLLCPHSEPDPMDGAPKAPSGQRLRIYDRDSWSCVYCDSPHELTLDHVIPRSRGGSNSDDNLVAACRRCNCRKGARTPLEWQGASS